jgi:predicted TIM-barrel fold metal-dependent hydrolase
VEVLDVHHHIGSLYHVLLGGQTQQDQASIDDEYGRRIRMMDDAGIAAAIVLPATGYDQPNGIQDTMRVNDAMAAYRARDPKRFPVAFGIVEPLHGMRGLEEMDRIHNELHLNGVVWHHRFQGVPIDAQIMRPMLQRLGDLGLIPFVHLISISSMENPWRLERLAREFPHITFVALDAFSGADSGRAVLDLAERTENILFDTAVFFSGPTFLKGVVDAIGSHRLLFGSDVYAEPSQVIATAPVLLDMIRQADISEQDKANILGLNAKRLFGLE